MIGTALVITGAERTSAWTASTASRSRTEERPEVAGHEVELNYQDDGCSAEGGTPLPARSRSEENIAAVIGTSCSSAGVPASEILSAEGILLVSPSNTAPS